MDKENIQPKVKEILITNETPENEKNVSCETFVYQPENVEEALLGHLCLVGRIQSGDSGPSHIINLMASTIKREYYKHPKQGPEINLREGLKKANAAIADLVKNEDVNWLSKTSFSCVALTKDSLYLTTIGRAKILLIRNNRITDLSKKLVPSQERPTPQKVFQSIASGKLFPKDKILLVADDILGIVSSKGLKQILDFGPAEQVQQLQKILDEEKDVAPQGLIIIEMIAGEKTLANNHEAITVSRSSSSAQVAPDSLFSSSRERSLSQSFAPLIERSKGISSELNLLSSSYLFRIKERAKFWREKFKKYQESLAAQKPIPGAYDKSSVIFEKTEEPTNSGPKPSDTSEISLDTKKPEPIEQPKEQPKIEMVVDISPTRRHPLNDQINLAEKDESPELGAKIHRPLPQRTVPQTYQDKETKESLTNSGAASPPNKSATPLSNIIQKLFETIRPTTARQFSLPNAGTKNTTPKSRPQRILATSILLIILIGGTGYALNKKYQNEIMYLEEVAWQSQEEQKEINKIEEVDPLLFADLSSLDANTSPEHILIAGGTPPDISSAPLVINRGNVLVIGGGVNTIAIVPIESGDLNKKLTSTSLPTDKSWSQAVALSDDSLILLTPPNNIYRYNFSTDKFSLLDLELPLTDPLVTDLVVYNEYLYLLDSQNDQIIRCALPNDCRPWLKEKYDLSQTNSMAIDSSIYLAQNNGIIDKFYTGRKETTLDPNIRPIDNAEIYTKINFKNIYVLNRADKRIVIIGKEGNLIKQLFSEKLSDMKDIEITDDEKTLFILSGQKIYKISL